MPDSLSFVPLDRFFSLHLEHVFLRNFGVRAPGVTDYLAGILTDFARVEHCQKVKNWVEKPLETVAEMLTEAAAEAGTRREREIHRHIGDLSLFWTGIYPEKKRQNGADAWLNYATLGKKSYARAAAWDAGDAPPPPGVLRTLSEDYELCRRGLTLVRQEIQSANIGRNM